MSCPQVLNLGHNQLSGTLDIVGLPALRALMLNDNQLAGVNGERRHICNCMMPCALHRCPLSLLHQFLLHQSISTCQFLIKTSVCMLSPAVEARNCMLWFKQYRNLLSVMS